MIPENEEEMRLAIAIGPAVRNAEGALLPEGLSFSSSQYSDHWYYREGNTIAILHEKCARDDWPCHNHVCFSIDRR